ncbi:EthD family reductase [Sphingomonas sp.]|uniref:EthD family reductase n=1 Tax=Sphingomonas sp. TaxID=28214 RepID=UPI0025F256AE|nr:EthD family reductase [Sphingomonas sp.]
MYIITIHYPNSDGATFDHEYYRTKHLPEVGKAFGPYGLGYASVLKGEESVDGTPPAYFITTILSFREEQGAREAIASDGGRALAADVPNFTRVRPLVQFNTAVP